jgi:hypothetical protein
MKPNLLYLLLDCVRYDSYCLAHTPSFDKIGQPIARQALGGATDQVVYSLLTGRLPGPEIVNIPELGIGGQTIGELNRKHPGKTSEWNHLLSDILQDHEYDIMMYAAAPPLCRWALLRELMMVYECDWCEDQCEAFQRQMKGQAWFCVMNWFEAHQPYRNKAGQGPDLDEYQDFWAKRKTLRKAWQGAPYEPINRQAEPGELDAETAAYLRELHRWQVKQVEHMDSVFGEMLLPKLPEGTRIWIMADHGQCFGEFGHHGHDFNLPPIMTIPFVRGTV